MKIEDFGPFTLSAGKHAGPKEGMCVMEMVSFLAGEKWSDVPECACPVIGKFCQVLNDRMGQEFRDKMQSYVPRLLGSVSPEHAKERAEFLAWKAIKVFAPISLDASGLNEQAATLREFDQSKGLKAAARAANAADAAVYAADAADAADAAARAADYSAYAARAARADAEKAIFEALDGVLKIGPSGTEFTPEQQARIPLLAEAV